MISWEKPWNPSPNLLWRVRTFPHYVLWSCAGFVSVWVQTRRMSNLLLGVPALAVAFLVFSVTLRSRQGLDSATIQRYVTTAQHLLQKGQVDQAAFYQTRLQSLQSPTDPILSLRAAIAIRRDQSDLAAACYREMLTNSDHTQNALAHTQLALREMQTSPATHREAADRAIRHLQLALEIDPGHILCHELLAQLFLQRGDFQSVAMHLEAVVLVSPDRRLDLARVYEKLGQHTQKAEYAAQAAAYFSESLSQLESAPRSGVQPNPPRELQRVTAYLNWTEALIMQGLFTEAAKTLTQAIDAQDSPELRRRLASIYIRMINDLPQSPESWKLRWELVTLSRNYDPNAREALVVLASIAAHAPPELHQSAQRELQPYFDNGQAPAAAFYLVGTAAAQDQRWEQAITLLRQSVKREPRADIAWNNLAHALSSKPAPEWKEAERCVDEAIRLNPTPALYHETRGQILVGQERWAEAVRELELALREFPLNAPIHQGLATSYAQLGDDDLADYHLARHKALGQR